MSRVSKKKLKTKVLSTYTGREYGDIKDILKDKRARDMLWLEILFNDKFPWEEYLNIPVVRKNYRKAGIWYNEFKTLLKIFGIKRCPLKKPARGKIDRREYRRFIEVLYYAHKFKKNN